MPIYDYRCDNGHAFEAFQSMSEEPLGSCEVCGAPASRRLSAPAVHFKGSGFYTTDYARKGAKGATASDGGTPAKADSKDSGSGSGSKTAGGNKDAGSAKSD